MYVLYDDDDDDDYDDNAERTRDKRSYFLLLEHQ